MSLTFHWINILILVGAFNALVFSVVLLFGRRHPGAMYFAAFVFVFAYNGFETFNWSSGLDRYYDFFGLFSFIVIYAVGPSAYLYVLSVLYPERKRAAANIAAHYGMVIFQFATRIVILACYLLQVNAIIPTHIDFARVMGVVWSYSEPLSVLMFLGYVTASVYEVRKFKRNGPAKGKDKQKNILRWINSLLWCLALLAVAWTATVAILYIDGTAGNVTYYPIELGLVLFGYWLVFNGYYQVKQFSFRSLKTIMPSSVHNEEYFVRLRDAMEIEKCYLDPELSLMKMAGHTGIPAKTISVLLNQYRNVSFAEFVNAYRVKEVSDRMMDPANRQFTISALALESGFNSQATFQRVFKNVTGMSPRVYLEQMQTKA